MNILTRGPARGVAATASRYIQFVANSLSGRGVPIDVPSMELSFSGFSDLLTAWVGDDCADISVILPRAFPSVRLDHGEIARVRRQRFGAATVDEDLFRDAFVSVFMGDEQPVRYAKLLACLDIRTSSLCKLTCPTSIAFVQWYDDVADLDPKLKSSKAPLEQLRIGKRSGLSDGRTLLDRSYLIATTLEFQGYEIIDIKSSIAREHLLEDPMFKGNFYIMDTRHY